MKATHFLPLAALAVIATPALAGTATPGAPAATHAPTAVHRAAPAKPQRQHPRAATGQAQAPAPAAPAHR